MTASWQQRYRGILISTVVFVLILLVLSAAQLYVAYTSNHNHETQNELNTTVYHLMDLDKSVHDVLQHMSESPQLPLPQTLYEGLSMQMQNIQKQMNLVQSGLSFYGGHFELRHLKDFDQNNLVSSILTSWQQVQSNLAPVLDTQSALPNSDSLRQQLLDNDQQVDLLVSYYRLLNTLINQSTSDGDLVQSILMLSRLFLGIGYLLIIYFVFIRRLKIEDEELMSKQQDYLAMINSVGEGLFLIDLDFNVSPQYSKALHQFVDFKPRRQMTLYYVLDGLVPKSQVQLLERFLKQILNPRIKQNLVGDLNPLNRVQVRDKNGDDRWLSFNFRRVFDDNKKVTAILASVRDTTDNIVTEKRLEDEREHSDMQLEMLTAMLRVDHNLLQSFIRNVVAGANRMNAILRRPSLRTVDFRAKIEDLFREAHTLKGEASALDLRLFVNLTTKMEEKLQIMSKQESLRGNDFFGFTIDLEDLMNNVEKTEQLLKRLGGIKVDNIEQLAREIDQVNENSAGGLTQYFEKFVQQIATRQGKLVNVELSGFDQHHLTQAQLDTVKEILIQLVRNAVVHGIESPKHRKAIGKNPEGMIHIELHQEGEQFDISVSDDGAGINLEALRDKAATMPEFRDVDVKSLSPKALYPVMFVSGFSTVVHANEDAGQGVGMGVVRERLQAINGKLGIESEAGAFTRFQIRFS